MHFSGSQNELLQEILKKTGTSVTLNGRELVNGVRSMNDRMGHNFTGNSLMYT